MSEENVTPNSIEPVTPTEPETPTEPTSLISDPEQKVEEKAPETPAEPEPVVPLTVDDLTIPEGYEVVEPLRDKFLEILNGDLSPKDRASALLALHKDTIDAAQEAGSTAWNTTQDEWKAEAKADPDVGGAKLQPALANIAKLIDEYGTTELRGVFDLTGAGNNVHVIKFLSKMADQLTEGNHLTPRLPGGDLTAEQKAQRMYPSMKG